MAGRCYSSPFRKDGRTVKHDNKVNPKKNLLEVLPCPRIGRKEREIFRKLRKQGPIFSKPFERSKGGTRGNYTKKRVKMSGGHLFQKKQTV